MSKAKAPTRPGGAGQTRTILNKPHNALVRSGIQEYAVLPENKQLFKDIQALEAEIAKGGIDAETVDNKVHQIQLKHYQRCQAKRAEVVKQFTQAKTQWERQNIPDAATRMITRQNYQAELAMMNQGEIAARVAEETDPDRLFAAALYCAEKNSDLLINVRSRIEETSADRPHLRDAKIKELHDLSELYSTEYGQVKLHPNVIGFEVTEDIQSLFEEQR